MASSDLLLQSLLGGQQVIDPAVAQFQPKMQLAQAMLQQGMDSSPTTKWGGLSRLASALTGGFLMNQNQEGLQGIADQRAKEAAAFGASLGDTLTPPSMSAGQPQASAQPNPNQPGMNLAPMPSGNGPGNVPPDLMPHFQAASQRTGIPLPLLLAQARQESTFRPGVVGPSGGVGIMQVQPSTAVNPGYGMSAIDPETLKDPATNINFGADYLAARAKAAGVTDWNDPTQRAKALTEYNGGGDPDYVPHVSRYLPPGSPQQSVQVAGPGAPTAAAPQPGSVAPSPGAQQQMTQAPQVGAASPYVAKALETIHKAQAAMIANPYNPAIQKAGQMAIENAHTMMGMDVYQTNQDGTQTNLRTGHNEDPAHPLPHYTETAPGVYTTPGGTDKPVFAPAGRVTVNNKTGEVITTGPGGPQVFQPPNTKAAGAMSAAESQGAEAGHTAITTPKLAAILQSSVQGLGTIDSAAAQLGEAAKNGIPTGYFTPALATAAQAAKSLGIDTSSLGVKPEGVSDIAAARKSLALVSGSIIRNILGPDTPITDSKLEQYVHATPGIETDPGALQKILGWARSQLVYEHNMALDGLKHADPNTGIIPGGWQAGYLTQNGGGPIYDPISGEMKQPTGGAPASATPPQASPTSQAAPSAQTPVYREGQTATGPGGAKMIFTGGHWVAK